MAIVGEQEILIEIGGRAHAVRRLHPGSGM